MMTIRMVRVNTDHDFLCRAEMIILVIMVIMLVVMMIILVTMMIIKIMVIMMIKTFSAELK